MKLILSLVFGLLSTAPIAAQVVRINQNTLPRGIETQSTFAIDVAIEDLRPDSFQPDYDYEKSVTIRLEKADASRDLPNADIGEQDLENIGFFVETRTEIDRGTADDGDWFVVVRVIISEDTRKISELTASDNTGTHIAAQAFFLNYESEFISDGVFTNIYESLQVANAAPKDFSVQGAYKSLSFSWTPEKGIEFKTSATDVKTDNPSGAVIVVFSSDADKLDLPTYKFLPDADSDEAGTACSIDYSKVGTDESCVVCDDNDGKDMIYLNYSELSSNYSELSVTSVGASGSATAKDLDPDRSYAAFAYYLPDGLVRSRCVSAQPSVNLTWSELNGEGQANASDPRCFVATAAYGSALDPRIDSLRWLRDHVLMRSQWGRDFIASYYKHAPRFTPYIENAPVGKKIVQLLLYPIVIFAEASQSFGFGWAVTILISTCLLLFLVSLQLRSRTSEVKS